jgi:hypothetical protein
MSNTTEQRDALINRLFQATRGTWDLLALYLGDRFGFYRALVNGPLTSTELAAATGTHERYVREWLEQQAAGGILGVDDADADVPNRHGGSGVEDRVTFHLRDAADPELAGRYDLVYIHEALHDMSYPVGVLGACRELLGEGAAGTGTVMRADTVRRYAEEAGFRTFEILPIENDFYRFYRLMP